MVAVSEAPRPTIPVPPDGHQRWRVAITSSSIPPLDHRPYFVFVSGAVRPPFLIEGDEVEIGRRVGAHLQLDEPAVSRPHAVFRRAEHGKFVLEDQSIVNRRSSTASHCCDRHQRALYAAARMPFRQTEAPTSTRRGRAARSPETWKTKPHAHAVAYDDPDAVDAVVAKLRRLPPLVKSWGIEELKSLIADAQDGRRFLLQGGDCAEMLDECASEQIAAKLKILI